MEPQTKVIQPASPKENTTNTTTNISHLTCDDESLLSDEASDAAVTTDFINDRTNVDDDEDDDQDSNAAPMHLHALRHPPRLSGTGLLVKNPSLEKINTGNNETPTPRSGRRSRSTSRPRSSGLLSNNSSRSTSPVTLCSSMDNPSTSGITSLDPDILTDKLGFIDLDPPLPHEIRCGPLADKQSGGLTPVNERLSEETLEDCHAFTDLYYKSSDFSIASGMPSVTHSTLSGGLTMGSNVSVGSTSLHSRDTVSVGGAGSVVGEGSVLGLGRLDEEDEDELGEELEVVLDGEGEEGESD